MINFWIGFVAGAIIGVVALVIISCAIASSEESHRIEKEEREMG